MRLPRLSSRIASRPAKRVRSLIRVFAKHFYPRSLGLSLRADRRTDGRRRRLQTRPRPPREQRPIVEPAEVHRGGRSGREGGRGQVRALLRCGMNLSLFLCWPRDRRLNLFTFFIEQTDRNFRVSGAYQLQCFDLPIQPLQHCTCS